MDRRNFRIEGSDSPELQEAVHKFSEQIHEEIESLSIENYPFAHELILAANDGFRQVVGSPPRDVPIYFIDSQTDVGRLERFGFDNFSTTQAHYNVGADCIVVKVDAEQSRVLSERSKIIYGGRIVHELVHAQSRQETYVVNTNQLDDDGGILHKLHVIFGCTIGLASRDNNTPIGFFMEELAPTLAQGRVMKLWLESSDSTPQLDVGESSYFGTDTHKEIYRITQLLGRCLRHFYDEDVLALLIRAQSNPDDEQKLRKRLNVAMGTDDFYDRLLQMQYPPPSGKQQQSFLDKYEILGDDINARWRQLRNNPRPPSVG